MVIQIINVYQQFYITYEKGSWKKQSLLTLLATSVDSSSEEHLSVSTVVCYLGQQSVLPLTVWPDLPVPKPQLYNKFNHDGKFLELQIS